MEKLLTFLKILIQLAQRRARLPELDNLAITVDYWELMSLKLCCGQLGRVNAKSFVDEGWLRIS